MPSFYSEVLTTCGKDQKKWHDLVDNMPMKDIFYTPEYAMVFERTQGEVRNSFGGKAHLFFYGVNQNYIVYPFFKRKISELPFFDYVSPKRDELFDIVSPYGYSGPIMHVSDKKVEDPLWKSFLTEFHSYCLENNIVAEFMRLHPFIRNDIPLKRFVSTLRESGEVVHIDLSLPKEVIWKNFKKSCRNAVTKAQRKNVKVFRSNTKWAISSFYNLYTETMTRRSAQRKYFFSISFFRDLFKILKGNVTLLIAKYEGNVISAAIFLNKYGFVHYYLSGSDINFLRLSPNELLLYKAIQRAKDDGYQIFNLGGGYQPNDSLFRFKASFSKSTVAFYTYAKVHHKRYYSLLCKAKDIYAKKIGVGVKNKTYFPYYRSQD